MEILLVNNVTRSMRPKNMQSSDLKTIIAKAENQMNGLCFCCIQNVNARSTGKKTKTTNIKNPKTHHPTYGTINFLKGKTRCYLLVPLTSHQSSLGLATISSPGIISWAVSLFFWRSIFYTHDSILISNKNETTDYC